LTGPWLQTPQFKLEAGGETYINDKSMQITNVRPENNISYLVVTLEDYKSKSYETVFDALGTIDLSLRYGSDSWKKVFSGVISTVAPQLSMSGEVLGVTAWGDGLPVLKTHCDESYGVESPDNSTVDTPKEILDDLITNHINKSFGGAATGWSIGNKVDNAHAGLSFTYLNSQYLNNFTMINRVCDVTNAYAQGLGAPEVSVHWFVDPTPNLYFKKIDADHSDTNWNKWWRKNAAGEAESRTDSTLEVAKDQIVYDFRKNVEEYANNIILTSKFRKPSEDYWTEDTGGAALWGTSNMNLTDSATHIVGSHSLLMEPTGGGANTWAYYPSTKNAAWNLTACGSPYTVPTLNFWIRRNHDIPGAIVELWTADLIEEMYFILHAGLTNFIDEDDEWFSISLPVGPYHYSQQTEVNKRWEQATAWPAQWTQINWIRFEMANDATDDMYIDDLHFAGVVVREAKDAAGIAANNEYQKSLRCDTALNDTLNAADDSGTAARLARAELLRRSQTPIVGSIRIPMAVDVLPGQLVHIHSCKQSDGTFRIDKDMRVKEVKHVIVPTEKHGFQTELNLTDDVTNTHAFGVPTGYSLMKEYVGALGHSEARDLKGGDIDNLIPRLSVSY